jgi:hypothetical protein
LHDKHSILCPQSITKVEEIHTTPLRSKLSRRTDGNAGRSRVKNSDLPLGTADRFARKVLPIALDTTGALGPWECPDDEEIIIIWNLIFGSPNEHPLTINDVKGDLFLAVKCLVRYVLIHLCCLLSFA